jgi:hypothetical protein
MAPDDAKQIALDCLRTWVNGDFERTRTLLDDGVTFAARWARPTVPTPTSKVCAASAESCSAST